MTKRQPKQDSLAAFVATFFCTFINREARNVLQADTKGARERYAGRLLEHPERLFFARSESSAPAGQIGKVLTLLYGLRDGYPYTHAAVAHLLGKTEKEIVEIEAEWQQNVSQTYSEFLDKRRKEWLQERPCKGCGATVGHVHEFGCEEEECLFCHGKVWKCHCAYKHLKLGWGGRSPAEWRELRKQHGKDMDRTRHIRPLTAEEKRQWSAIVMRKGPVPYGGERCY